MAIGDTVFDPDTKQELVIVWDGDRRSPWLLQPHGQVTDPINRRTPGAPRRGGARETYRRKEEA